MRRSRKPLMLQGIREFESHPHRQYFQFTYEDLTERIWALLARLESRAARRD
jgi:hypothetical protein